MLTQSTVFSSHGAVLTQVDHEMQRYQMPSWYSSNKIWRHFSKSALYIQAMSGMSTWTRISLRSNVSQVNHIMEPTRLIADKRTRASPGHPRPLCIITHQ